MRYVGTHLRQGENITDLPIFIKKKKHNLTPLYLSSLISQSVSNLFRYNLQNANNLQSIDARTLQYYNLLLPSTTRDCNT